MTETKKSIMDSTFILMSNFWPAFRNPKGCKSVQKDMSRIKKQNMLQHKHLRNSYKATGNC